VSRSPFGAIVAAALALSAAPAIAQDVAPSVVDAAAGAAAIAGPFAIGATVKDSAGEVVGRITRLTTAPDGSTLVMVRLGVDSFAVPAARLHMRGAEVVSTLTKAELKAEGRQAQK
jgi:hypothetical protein